MLKVLISICSKVKISPPFSSIKLSASACFENDANAGPIAPFNLCPLTKNAVLIEVTNYWYLLVAVLIGGQIGNFLNLKIFPVRILALVTASLVLFVAARLGIRLSGLF